jgi:nucleotide-binding universal stress UspA family protein
MVEDRPVRAMARESRAADLIVAGGSKAEFGDDYRRADPAELALASGRPVLVAPIGAPALRGKAVVVAWKDTREARRALHDALPFLQRAEDVVVMAVCDDAVVQAAQVETADVAAALLRRGVHARSMVVSAPDRAVADEINAEAAAAGADLIVAGAYGHSRFAEWVLGGATRDLLDNPQRYLLISH